MDDFRELVEAVASRAAEVVARLNLGGPIGPSGRERTTIDQAAEALLAVEPRVLAVVAQRLRASCTLSSSGAATWASSFSLGADAAVSIQRSGRAREEALRRLSLSPDPRVVPFLLLRLDDIVPQVRVLAGEAVRARLLPGYAAVFARSLGLITVLGGRQRGQVRAVREFLAAPAQRSALVALYNDPDPKVRVQAFRLSLEGDPEVVLRALVDPAPSVWLWAARVLCSGQVPVPVRLRGLPRLENSRAPRVRLMALQAIDRTPRELEERWLFDAHSSVRYEARVRLKAAAPEQSYSRPRKLAIALLQASSTPPSQLVGALGTLADVGRGEDVLLIEGFLAMNGPVRREARRTLGILRGLHG